ncbi:MAG: hypothetical protein V4736_05800 [Bdellovibrionota bacterium]
MAVLVSFLSIQVQAAPPISSSMQVEAEKLVLRKKRMEAINLLWEPGKIKKDTPENRKLLERISNLFLSEKAQNTYEEVLSWKRNDPTVSLDKINEALVIEPDNLLLLLEKGRLQVRKNDCEKASETLLPYTKINFPSEDLQILHFITQVCRGAKILGTNITLPAKNKKISPLWLLAELDHLDQTKESMKIRENLSQLEALGYKSPQIYYWNWKLQKAAKKQDVEAARKYNQTCKNLSSSQFREYFKDPHLCQYLGEVDENAN